MSTKQLLTEIERGINALQKAHALVLMADAVTPKAKATAAKKAKAVKKAARGPMSAEGRARIVAAQHKRWAKVKREKNKAAKATLATAAAK